MPQRPRITTALHIAATLVLAAVALERRAGRLAGWVDPGVVREETSPSPFFRADPLLGYSAAPGVYVHTWSRRNAMTGAPEQVRTRVTINPDGTRFVGAER